MNDSKASVSSVNFESYVSEELYTIGILLPMFIIKETFLKKMTKSEEG